MVSTCSSWFWLWGRGLWNVDNLGLWWCNWLYGLLNWWLRERWGWWGLGLWLRLGLGSDAVGCEMEVNIGVVLSRQCVLVLLRTRERRRLRGLHLWRWLNYLWGWLYDMWDLHILNLRWLLPELLPILGRFGPTWPHFFSFFGLFPSLYLSRPLVYWLNWFLNGRLWLRHGCHFDLNRSRLHRRRCRLVNVLGLLQQGCFDRFFLFPGSFCNFFLCNFGLFRLHHFLFDYLLLLALRLLTHFLRDELLLRLLLFGECLAYLEEIRETDYLENAGD